MWTIRPHRAGSLRHSRDLVDIVIIFVFHHTVIQSARGLTQPTPVEDLSLPLQNTTPLTPIVHKESIIESPSRDASANDCLVPIQPPSSTWCGVNATSLATVNLLDNGNGLALYSARFSNGTTVSGSPTNLLFGKQCSLLFGSLTITMKRTMLAPYVAANINTWLTRLGLANLQVISGGLTIFVDHLPYNIPPQQNPIFLSSLQQVQLLTIAECLNCAASPGIPPRNASALVFLQGLRSLQKFYDMAKGSFSNSALSVTGTAFTNMGSLVGLTCAPGSVTIKNNRELISLAGFESLTTFAPGPSVDISSNGLLSSSSVSALRNLAGCPRTFDQPTLSSSVLIATIECSARCWGQYCSYANDLGCNYFRCSAGFSSPPPPPPVTAASCTPRLPTPACGALGDFVSVRDTGDGLCTAFGYINSKPFINNCSAPLFGVVCDKLLPQMVLTYMKPTTGAYRPQMARWLSQLGLGSLTVMARPLTITVDHTPNPITTPLNPFFLGSLLQVGALVVYECANCTNSVSIGPATPALQSLPGLVNIDRFRDFTQSPSTLGSLILRNTAFQNMLSFSGIRCTPGLYSILGNRALTSLTGFEGIGYSYFRPGPFATVVDNNDFLNVDAWKTMAGCGSSSPIINNGVTIRKASFNGLCTIQCWDSYCRFLSTGSGNCYSCTPSPPPPPPSPPPPPVLSPPPPPPRPPIPSNPCPLNIARATPVCGTTLQKMTLTFGGTSCTAKFTAFPALISSQTYPCATANPFPGQTCGTFLGDILITFGPDFPVGPSSLAQTYLTQLGVGNIVWVQNLLLGRDGFWQGRTILPTLLPRLQFVEGIFGVTTQVTSFGSIIGGASVNFAPTGMTEMLDSSPIIGTSAINSVSASPGPSSPGGASAGAYSLPGVTVPSTGFGIAALPGQAALKAVGNLLILFGTSFTDLGTFPGLQCVGTYWMSDNPVLARFNGIEPLATAPPGGLIYDSAPESNNNVDARSTSVLSFLNAWQDAV
eukprot:jgi/Botrbrau1/10879/Bobra.0025s0056.1